MAFLNLIYDAILGGRTTGGATGRRGGRKGKASRKKATGGRAKKGKRVVRARLAKPKVSKGVAAKISGGKAAAPFRKALHMNQFKSDRSLAEAWAKKAPSRARSYPAYLRNQKIGYAKEFLRVGSVRAVREAKAGMRKANQRERRRVGL